VSGLFPQGKVRPQHDSGVQLHSSAATKLASYRTISSQLWEYEVYPTSFKCLSSRLYIVVGDLGAALLRCGL